MKALLAKPVLVDLRNIYDRGAAEAAGLEYHAVGR
jgi:UDPglucose 6-dehydrogenase